MDRGLKKWVIQHHEKLQAEEKTFFLKALKFAPEQALLRAISNALDNWCLFATVETCEIVSVNFNRDPKEILETLKEHFAKELAAITK